MADSARAEFTDLVVELYELRNGKGKRVYSLREVARMVSQETGKLCPFSTAAYCWRVYLDEQRTGEPTNYGHNARTLRPLPWPEVLISCQVCGHTRPVERLPAKCPHCGTVLRINEKLAEGAAIWQPPEA